MTRRSWLMIVAVIISMLVACDKPKDEIEEITLTDVDGNVYSAVTIGTQVWMAENMKVTHYRNGTAISHVTVDTVWADITTEAYCIYNNNSSNEVDTYGALYNWYAVNGDTDGDGVKDKEIAPAGWHVPSDVEWKELVTYLSNNGHNGLEGIVLKSTTGWNLGGNGTDDYGFTVLPGGYREHSNGSYLHLGNAAYFWSATEIISTPSIPGAWSHYMHKDKLNVGRTGNRKNYGNYIRLLRD